MSWSVVAIGKPPAVAIKLAEEFGKMTYVTGPEAEIKDAISVVVAKALADYSGSSCVNVGASGSASNWNGNKTQTVNLTITPVFGFVE